MNVTIKGKQLDTGDAFRSYIEDALSRVVEKYFQKATDAIVTVTQDAHLYKADISVNAARGIFMQSSAEETEVYPAFDSALDKMDKRLRRYKKRLKDSHNRGAAEVMTANSFVLEAAPETSAPANEDSGQEEHGEPAIIAEMQTDIQTMTVAEAVMRLDLSQEAAILFRNSAHNGLNMVYRRADGNIGWVDPRALEKASAA